MINGAPWPEVAESFHANLLSPSQRRIPVVARIIPDEVGLVCSGSSITAMINFCCFMEARLLDAVPHGRGAVGRRLAAGYGVFCMLGRAQILETLPAETKLGSVGSG